MTHSLLLDSCRIARLADYQGARPVNVTQVAVEKSATEKFPPSRLMKGKTNIIISSFNVRTLRDNQIHELVVSAIMHKIDVICIQEHRYVHDDIRVKNTM